MPKLPFSLLALALAASTTATAMPQRSVIYGEDSRHEVFEEKDVRVAALVRATVALVDRTALTAISPDTYRIDGNTLGRENKLCRSERFREQTAGADCSGFLATPNTVITAGHCIETKSECLRTAFVFDYAYDTKSARPEQIAKRNVYTCGRVIKAMNTDTGDDYAVIELDRAVPDREPLELELRSQIGKGDSLFVIGHPSGIPAKIADGASVRDQPTSTRLIADLDVYGGNSGSAVFNAETRKVEGILVDGEEDFVMTSRGCRVSQRCRHGSCSGEAIVRISRVLPYLQGLPL